MTFRIRILPNSATPIFGQIVQQVRQGVAQGGLHPGDQIPTVRELARELLVNPNTVAKAYQQLEQAGVISTKRGSGTFVANPTCRLADEERERRLGEKIDVCLTEAVHLELPKKQVKQCFSESLEKFKWPRGRARPTEQSRSFGRGGVR